MLEKDMSPNRGTPLCEGIHRKATVEQLGYEAAEVGAILKQEEVGVAGSPRCICPPRFDSRVEDLHGLVPVLIAFGRSLARGRQRERMQAVLYRARGLLAIRAAT